MNSYAKLFAVACVAACGVAALSGVRRSADAEASKTQPQTTAVDAGDGATTMEPVPSASPMESISEVNSSDFARKLVEVASRIPDQDERETVQSAITGYEKAVSRFEESLEELPSPVAQAILDGDTEAVAKAAAIDPAIVDQVVAVKESYATASKARDVAVAAVALVNPSVAADLNRILDVLDSRLPAKEKFVKILEIVVQRLLFLLKAMVAAKSGDPSGVMDGVADDGGELAGVAARLLGGGGDKPDAIEAYFADGGRVRFELPPDLPLDQLAEVFADQNTVQCGTHHGLPMLQIVSHAGELLLKMAQPEEGPAIVVVD